MKNVEIELKYPIRNSTQIIEKLNKIAEIKKRDYYQKDTYYIPAHRNFLEKKPISEWLRLRDSKTRSTINYKNWHNSKGDAVSCDEFETTIEDTDMIVNIFKKLNFKEIIIVEKTRNTWFYKNVEIAIDNVAQLGEFIELEAKGNFSSIENAKKHLYCLIDELNIETGSQDFLGYPFRLLKKNGIDFN